MSWNGYVAIGNYTSSVFTESTATGYARSMFTFNTSNHGMMQGTGFPITFTATSAVTSYNALAFFAAVTGGNQLLVYQVLPFNYGLNYPHIVYPGSVAVDLLDSVTSDGLPVDLGSASAISGVQPMVANQSTVSSLTAHAGGGQASAVLLTTTLSEVTTVATAADSVKLPLSIPGVTMFVANAAASNSMNVFPNTGDQINVLGANTAYALAAGHSAWFISSKQGQWRTISGS